MRDRENREYYDWKLEERVYSLKACGWCFVGMVIFLLLSFLFSGCNDREYKRQIRELQARLAQAEEHPDTFFIHDSIPVWKEKVVEVDRTDYKQLLADKELIKSLQLKVAQVEAENRMLLGTRDTVYLEKGRDSVLRYTDKWADFAYYEDRKKLEYAVRDSITTFISREYKHRFLWWKWGTKGYNVHHVNHNPKGRIYYNKYIKVK